MPILRRALKGGKATVGLASGYLHVYLVKLGLRRSPAIDAMGLKPRQCRVVRVGVDGSVTWTLRSGVAWDALRRDRRGKYGIRQ